MVKGELKQKSKIHPSVGRCQDDERGESGSSSVTRGHAVKIG